MELIQLITLLALVQLDIVIEKLVPGGVETLSIVVAQLQNV